MTGPLDESKPVSPGTRWLPIRTIAIAPGDDGWRVDVDIDDDREPYEAPTDVRLAIVATDTCVQIPLPVETLRELARVIGEVLTDLPPQPGPITPSTPWADMDARLERQPATRRRRPPAGGGTRRARDPNEGENG